MPEPLRPWVDWVLRGHEQALCPSLHGEGQPICVWPGRLALDLGERGGEFVQEVWIDAAGAFDLPGDRERWPEEVRVGGRPAPVSDAGGRPQLHLEPGLHELRGSFRWPRLPALLPVPLETGLVALTLGGRTVPFPERDESGALWLAERGAGDAAGERRLDLEVYRRVADEVPLLLDTRLTLRVSGPPREEALGPALPPGFVPYRLESELPARLEPDGTLRVQVRAGVFQIGVAARHEGPVAALSLPAATGAARGLAEREVWVFEARPALRLVTVEGAPVDPQQTDLPGEWRALPAYRMEPGTELRLVERRRGDAEPAPDELSLQRSWHLDFEGGGATVSDRIEGTLHARSRLEMGEGTLLGRAAVNGSDQFLTHLAAGAKAGVQLSPGPVTIEADSRAPASARLRAVGWDHDFAKLEGTLELPPGYELLHASGVDRADSTWLNRWTLLDLFLALVVAVAFLRLYGPVFGGLAALTLALTATEPGAPRFVWVAVLAVEALRRVVPPGRFTRVLGAARAAALAALVFLAVPFAVQALRAGLYPALLGPPARPAKPAEVLVGALEERNEAPASDQVMAPAVPESAPGKSRVRRHIDVGRLSKGEGVPEEQLRGLGYIVDSTTAAHSLAERDPNARITTGPGVPSWSWRRVALHWSGPVERTAELRLFLLPPAANALLALVRALLLGALVARVLGVRVPRFALPAVPGAALAIVFGAQLAASPPARAADFPPAELLDDLRTRLTEDPACAPACASLGALRLEARGDTLRLDLDLSAVVETAVPLPGGASSWLPVEVKVDGAPARALLRAPDGTLWLRVAPGAHRVELDGPLPPRASVALPLPLLPHRGEARVEGWTLQGLRPDGTLEGTLLLLREARETAAEEAPREDSALPPFLHVERTLQLALTWGAVTRVDRLSPAEGVLVIEVPLVAGEAVTSADVEVRGDKVRLSFAPGETTKIHSSRLEPRGALELSAPEGVPWSETWRVRASPIWQLTHAGIPPVQPAGETGGADFEWRPWPGESVSLQVERPEGIGGATLTIDSSQRKLRPGVRSTDATLSLALRSSQGGEHRVTLPEGATLQRVAIGGVEQPLRQEGRAVVLPLRPGIEPVELAWREAGGISVFWRAAEVDLGADSVNAEVEVEPPAGRWVLWVSGPRLGPAVLFWPVLAAYLGIAAALGRTRIAPLRARHWALLALGLTQVGVVGAGVVALWLLALGWRAEHGTRVPGRWFDLLQLALAALTLAALAALFAAIRGGLLGLPDMQVAGNGSSSWLLRWYQDRSGPGLPRPRVVSLPLGVYRLAMLAWALWIAQALIGWLRFGWRAFSAGELWRPLRRRPAAREGAAGGPP